MIISEKQVMQLLAQLKDHQELVNRIYGNHPHTEYLCKLYFEIIDQQSEELKVIE